MNVPEGEFISCFPGLRYLPWIDPSEGGAVILTILQTAKDQLPNIGAFVVSHFKERQRLIYAQLGYMLWKIEKKNTHPKI